MNEPQAERTYDFLRDAEELKRLRNDPSYRPRPEPVFTRKERRELAALAGFVVTTVVVALVFVCLG